MIDPKKLYRTRDGRKAALVEKVAAAIFNTTPFREHSGPFAEQSDRYQAFTRMLATAALTVALEEAADAVCEVGDHADANAYISAIRALVKE